MQRASGVESLVGSFDISEHEAIEQAAKHLYLSLLVYTVLDLFSWIGHEVDEGTTS